MPDAAILEDLQRAGITINFIPFRCRYGHTARRVLGPLPRGHYVATCGYCGEAVLESKRNSKGGRLNHAACVAQHTPAQCTKPHRCVLIPTT